MKIVLPDDVKHVSFHAVPDGNMFEVVGSGMLLLKGWLRISSLLPDIITACDRGDTHFAVAVDPDDGEVRKVGIGEQCRPYDAVLTLTKPTG